MFNFALHTIETAPEGSKVQEKYGLSLNNWAVLAESPAAFQGYMNLVQPLFEIGTLSPAEQALVQLTVSHEHECRYCVPYYTFSAPSVALDAAVVKAIRERNPIPDDRLATLHDFTLSLVRNRGKVTPAEVQAFFDAGFNKAQLLEILAGIAAKTMMNYLTQVVDIPLDDVLTPFAWEPEKESV